ncbi:flavin-containing monooxygenase [Gordonia soli]|uniref:Putative monooxygenase n=1 Tax=Gordonia soli NBRC 108243 TaxID=1223545 RepID=M0QL13_9ACTN|nr:NAD(P)/FAD-dependent oxidoreductase [Gordonia soli]GAC69248.1 putative monooxygenase [Gordonia soli NBRC 108243]
MTGSTPGTGPGESTIVDHDLVIIGAGLSGIDAAYRFTENDPDLRYVVLDRRERIGGTWDLFRYPGIRSDSDIYTLSFPFEPWRRPEALAQGAHIREYIDDTAHKYGIADHIRFGRDVERAEWDSATGRWTVTARVGSDGTTEIHRCRFVYFATGYYDQDHPFTPSFVGLGDFRGTVVHPQQWPDDLDYDGRRVVVIGSGATAVSMIPDLAHSAAHVTMLQRSPSYIYSSKQKEYFAPVVRRVLPESAAHRVVRARYAVQTAALVHAIHRFPRFGRKLLRANITGLLPEGYPIDVHFSPAYNPWDERMCMVPDGDLFAAISDGSVEVVTDHIDRFDDSGILLGSGRHLDADLVVTATGMDLLTFGGIRIVIDDAEIDPRDRFAYRGHLLEDVPNLAWSVGYTNASWTLRADMSARAAAKLFHHMRSAGIDRAYPHLRDDSMPSKPLWDLRSGYVRRRPDAFPKSGTRRPWNVRHNYFADAVDDRRSDRTDSMVFVRSDSPR